MEHPFLRKMAYYCLGRVLICVYFSLYRAIKSQFPLDVGGLSRDGQVTTYLGTETLAHAVSILTPEDFKTIVATELEDDFEPCLYECEGSEGSKQVCVLAW